MPAHPSWLVEPSWAQSDALLPARPVYDPAHPLGCHPRGIDDRIVFDELIQALRFGCPHEGIADPTCSATTIRVRTLSDEGVQVVGAARTIGPGLPAPAVRPSALEAARPAEPGR